MKPEERDQLMTELESPIWYPGSDDVGAVEPTGVELERDAESFMSLMGGISGLQ